MNIYLYRKKYRTVNLCTRNIFLDSTRVKISVSVMSGMCAAPSLRSSSIFILLYLNRIPVDCSTFPGKSDEIN